MNKKGFTLVELLAVIAVMALLIIITATSGFGVFKKAKGGINQIEEDNLIEAAKVFLVDVENDFVSSYPSDCTQDDFLNGNTCNVKVSYIIDKYMDKTPKSCDGNKFLNLSIEKKLDANGLVKEINYLVEKQLDASGNEEVICTK